MCNVGLYNKEDMPGLFMVRIVNENYQEKGNDDL